MTLAVPRLLRIGVDCGGTNTDAVILDLTPGAQKVVIDATKSATTPDVTHGIQAAVSTVLDRSVPYSSRGQIQAVSIGTTHFVNALIQRSADQLDRVAVVRLCGPFSRMTRPFAAFPYELREIMEGPHFFVEGGLQIDGRELSKVDEKEIEAVCEKIKSEGIRTVAITGVYAPIDFTLKQEEQVEAVIKRCIPGVYTSCSKDVANMGLLERENATILNCSLLPFAALTVQGFRTAVKALGLTCPVFVTSNDGTLLSLEQAAVLPIRTFSSGPTNSMRGASFLSRLAEPDGKRETALVIDIGGTTTEVGVLLPSGFPRQAASQHDLCGVRLNFAMPHVTSIGLGGGSHVRQDAASGKVTVGPDSVGYRLTSEALVFGGSVLTATDIAVAAGSDIGDASKVQGLSSDLVNGATARMKVMLELTIDSMKTSTQDIPVYLAGGGAMLCPDDLHGVSKVHRFPHYECANAVGAAIAHVAGTVDTVEEMGSRSVSHVKGEIEARAVARAVAAGAKPETVKIIESEVLPVAYTAGKCRFFVKAAGEWSGTGQSSLDVDGADRSSRMLPKSQSAKSKLYPDRCDTIWRVDDILTYRPNVIRGEWTLSELDLEFICIGTYILGCGGGGDPWNTYIGIREMVRAGARIRVVDLSSLAPKALIGWGGSMGSPEVGSERLLGHEYIESTKELLGFLKIDKLDALLALEIGGSNGMINMVPGASTLLDLPIVDGDFMGRAYPVGWQVTPNVFDTSTRGENIIPSCIASGDGNVMFMTKAKHYTSIDASLRAACVEMGTRVGHSRRPHTVEFCTTAMIRNTLSLSWRIGRAVMLAQKQGNIANAGGIIIDALGGPSSGRVLFAGKIIDVNRRVFKGHSVGEVVIAALALEEESESDQLERFSGVITIPFKNENLYVKHDVDGTSKILATVPDLISVLDAGNGLALGTQDYKYGLRVIVLGVTAAPQWTSTKRGLEIGDLRAFGIDDIPYQGLGKYSEPRSVIEEFNVVV